MLSLWKLSNEIVYLKVQKCFNYGQYSRISCDWSHVSCGWRRSNIRTLSDTGTRAPADFTDIIFVNRKCRQKSKPQLPFVKYLLTMSINTSVSDDSHGRLWRKPTDLLNYHSSSRFLCFGCNSYLWYDLYLFTLGS